MSITVEFHGGPLDGERHIVDDATEFLDELRLPTATAEDFMRTATRDVPLLYLRYRRAKRVGDLQRYEWIPPKGGSA